jgi:PAS domain-containing protein
MNFRCGRWLWRNLPVDSAPFRQDWIGIYINRELLEAQNQHRLIMFMLCLRGLSPHNASSMGPETDSGSTNAQPGGEVTPDEVRLTVASLISTPLFRRSPQLVGFLTYVVNETLSGRGDTLKSYVIATEVFGRPANFDPATDAIVRVEARRLRETLSAIYKQPNLSIPVLIEIPTGRYKPLFSRRLADGRALNGWAGVDRRYIGLRPVSPQQDNEASGDLPGSEDLLANLDEAETRLRLAAELAGLVTWSLSLHTGQVTWSGNARVTLGLESGSVPAFYARIHPEDRAAVEAAIEEALGQSGTLAIAFRVMRPSGETTILSLRATPIQGGAMSAHRLVGVAISDTRRPV